MWIVAKYERKNYSSFIQNLNKVLEGDLEIYNPMIKVKNNFNLKSSEKNINLLGDYVFCYSRKFRYKNFLTYNQYIKGLKYFLNGFSGCQKDITNFINKCRSCENKDGSISINFFELKINKKYKFNSGPLLNLIFELLEVQKKKLKILVGNKITKVDKRFLITQL